MEVIILTIVVAAVVIVVLELIIYTILRKKFQAIETIKDSAIRLDTTVSSIEILHH